MALMSTLFLVRPDNGLMSIAPSAPTNEDELQILIANHPELIGGGEDPLLLVQREQGVPDSADGQERWSIDHVFVSRDAVPVLVEVKRAVDTRLRREVVGQLLDYAANGVAYWPAGSLRARFEAACNGDADPEAKLLAFLGEAADVASFRTRVDDNLRTGRIKLMFVADAIPVELARIVEFLNDQMRADVRAVELNYYHGPDGSRLLAPRVIGETERSRAQKEGVWPRLEPIFVTDWFQQHIGSRHPHVLEGAQSMLALMQELTFLTKFGTGQIAFAWLGGSPAMADKGLRQNFYDKFASAVGPLGSKNLNGFPSFPLERPRDPERLQRFRAVAEEFVNACTA